MEPDTVTMAEGFTLQEAMSAFEVFAYFSYLATALTLEPDWRTSLRQWNESKRRRGEKSTTAVRPIGCITSRGDLLDIR